MAFQCVEIITRYANDKWNDAPSGTLSSGWWGNASNFWWHHPSHFTAYRDGGTYQPRIGDIMVWGPVDSTGAPNAAYKDTTTGHDAGHVAIIRSWTYNGNNTWTINTLEQNYTYNGTTLVATTTETLYKYVGDNSQWDYTMSSYDHIEPSGSGYYGVLHSNT